MKCCAIVLALAACSTPPGKHDLFMAMATPEALPGGVAEVLPPARARLRMLGSGCPDSSGVAPYIHKVSDPLIGTAFKMTLAPNGLAGGVPRDAWLFVAYKNDRLLGMDLPIDLGPLGLAGCTLYVKPEHIIDIPTAGLDHPFVKREEDSQVATLSIPMAPGPGVMGLKFYLQMVTTDGTTFYLSNAWEVTVGLTGPEFTKRFQPR